MSTNTLNPAQVGSAIPKGSTVFITGVNGYIGSHIADQVLAAGFAVRGSVRSAAKGDAIAAVLTRRHPAATFAYVVVPDFAVPGAFDAHLRGCAGVIHAASDLTFAPDPERIIKPVVAALRSVLASAQAAGVRRFVYTSSSTAALMPTLEKRFTVDAATWNDATVDKVWREHAAGKEVDGFDVYSASKCSAERAAWEFMEKEKPGFVLNCVLPNFNGGYVLDTAAGASTCSWVRNLWQHPEDEKAAAQLREFAPQHYIDVQDDAKLHVAALAEEDVKSERLFAFAEPYNFNTWLAIFRKLKPDGQWPADDPKQQRDLSVIKTERSVELLQRYGQKGFMPIEESVRNAVMS